MLNEVDEKHDIGLDDKTGANATDEMNALSGNFNEQVIMNETMLDTRCLYYYLVRLKSDFDLNLPHCFAYFLLHY